MFSTVSCSELLKELNFLINSKHFQEKGSNWCCIWRRLISVVDWASNHIRYFKPLKHLKSPWHQNESFVAWIMFYNRQDHANTWLSSSSLRRCSIKKVFFNISQNLQENWCFPVNFARFYKSTFLQNTSERLLLCNEKSIIGL